MLDHDYDNFYLLNLSILITCLLDMDIIGRSYMLITSGS